MEEIIVGIYADKADTIKEEYDNLLYGIKQVSQIIGQLIRQNMRNKSLEDYICYFLTVIISAAVEKERFLFDLEDTMQHRMQSICKPMHPNITSLLEETLVLTNRRIEERLSVSPKTAIGYLKSLEDMSLVRPIKSGREKFHINELAYQLLQR